jgi:acetylornithine aminotransferase
MEEEHLVENAAKVGEFLLCELKKLAGSYHIVDVRGEGLMIGIELDIPYKEPRTRLIKEERCFTGCSGTNVIRLLPPLCLSMDEAESFLSKLKNVLS